jgi:hypothetical protein
MITQSELKADFATMVADPWRWLNAAQNLFLTAEQMESRIQALWKSVHDSFAKKEPSRTPIEVADYQKVYMVLIGFCIENLLKGNIIEQDREGVRRETSKTGKLPEKVKTHDLLVLANNAILSSTNWKPLSCVDLQNTQNGSAGTHLPHPLQSTMISAQPSQRLTLVGH